MGVIYVEGGNELTERIANAASEYFSLTGGARVELVMCSQDEIRELNERTRGVDKVTDVLSFPALTLESGRYADFCADNFPLDTDPDSGRVELGSIVICDEVAEMQAEEYGHSAERERGYLFLHGLLHLLGFDHMQESDKTKMRTAEEDILGRIDLSREH